MTGQANFRGWGALIVAVLIFLLDEASKERIITSFRLGESVPLADFLNVGYWLNPGAAFSLLSEAGGWQRYFFSAIALGAVVWLCWALLFNKRLNASTRAAFALIAGGAAGNLYDRITRGAVVDWIDLHWGGWHWPAFNLADCGIVVGAILLILGTFGAHPHSSKP